MDYAIYYNDGGYLTYTMTPKQYDKLCEALSDRRSHVKLADVGYFRLDDVRSVIPLEPEVVEESEGASPELSAEEINYLHGIRSAQEAEDDDTEYLPGGML